MAGNLAGRVRALAARATSERASGRYLRFALLSTMLVFFVGNGAMVWVLYGVARPTQPYCAPVSGGPPLVVAIARTPGSGTEWSSYARVIASMQKDLDRPLQVRYVPDRDEIIELVQTGSADIAFLCTYCYLKLSESGDVVSVATPVIRGQEKEAAVLVVSDDSTYRSLADLKGARVALGYGTSLGGSAYYYWLLEHEGHEPSFARIVCTDRSQESNLTDILSGAADATVVNRSQLAAWPSGRFRVLAESPEFGMPPVAVSKDMDEKTRAEVAASLMLAAGRGALGDSELLEGFVPSDASGYGFANELMAYTQQQVGGR